MEKFMLSRRINPLASGPTDNKGGQLDQLYSYLHVLNVEFQGMDPKINRPPQHISGSEIYQDTRRRRNRQDAIVINQKEIRRDSITEAMIELMLREHYTIYVEAISLMKYRVRPAKIIKGWYVPSSGKHWSANENEDLAKETELTIEKSE